MRIENGKMSISIKEEGAELTSIKYKGNEFLWNGDKKYWGRQSPVLFPIVGRLKDDSMLVDGVEYFMGQHGFARDSEFRLILSSENEAKYLLTYSEETLKIYPYKFELMISYKVFDNKVEVTYEVKNVDDKKIFFSIGGHPAFKWPLVEGENFEDYYIEFSEKETQQFIENKSGLLERKNSFIIKECNRIDLSKEKFSIDTFVFDKPKSDKVSLKSKKSSAYISIYLKNFPYLGIWSKENEANFICIEPWYGIADFLSCDKNFKTKEGICELEIGKSFKCSYEVEVGC